MRSAPPMLTVPPITESPAALCTGAADRGVGKGRCLSVLQGRTGRWASFLPGQEVGGGWLVMADPRAAGVAPFAPDWLSVCSAGGAVQCGMRHCSHWPIGKRRAGKPRRSTSPLQPQAPTQLG